MASNSHSLDLEASSSQYATAGDSTSLDLSGDFTIEAWVKMESLPSVGTNMAIVSKHGAPSQYGYFCSVYNNAGVQSMNGGVSSTGNDFDYHTISLGTFNTGTWYHLAYVFTASLHKVECYKDGVSLGTDTSGTLTSVKNNTQLCHVGAINQGAPGSFFDGLIDEVKIYNDIRTPTEILADMYSSPPTGSNLQAYWALNNAYTDASGNSNTLTASGSPVFSTAVPFADYTGNSAFFAFM
jgi:hypothetical protein